MTISGYLSQDHKQFLTKEGIPIFTTVKVTKGKVPSGKEVLHVACYSEKEDKWYRGKGSMNCAITLRGKD